MRKEMRAVAVVGTGTIGTGWAAFFLSRGLTVHLYDTAAGLAHAAADHAVRAARFVRDRGLAPAGTALGMVGVHEQLEDALRQADFVQEAVFEDYEVKKPVFAAMDQAASPDVCLASSSSGLLMSEIQTAARRHPERCLIAHPINPVYLIPLVEIVPGRLTDHAFTQGARAFFERLGKVPVTLKREVPGYLENRMTAALYREAVDLVHRGVANVEDVDRAIWAGPGLRYALLGPLMIYHLGGGGVRRMAEHFGPALTSWWQDLQTWTSFPPGAVDTLEAGLQEAMHGRTLEEIAAWRDERLVELLRIVGSR